MAASLLERYGYNILERNFSRRVGEIDIIADDRGELVFVEVRSSHSLFNPDPAYSIDSKKQSKIVKAAQVYLTEAYPDGGWPPVRFDVVLVRLGCEPPMELLRNAFQADGSFF